MVARYKVHKFRDKWNDGYFKPVFSDPDAVERQQARKEVMQGLQDNEDCNDLLLKAEAQWDAEMRLDYNCWSMSKADPDYVCKCFEDKKEE